jgi:hypothetical protein
MLESIHPLSAHPADRIRFNLRTRLGAFLVRFEKDRTRF